MTYCENPEGITIAFPSAGVEVGPLDSDIRKQRRHFARAQFELSEEAGSAIGTHVDPWSLAIIKFDGYRADRMVLPRDGLKFRKDFDDSTKAILELYDARNICDRTVIESKETVGGTIEDAVAELLSRRQDPDNVISDYEIIDPDSLNYHVIKGIDQRDGLLNDIGAKIGNATKSVAEFAGFDGGGDVDAYMTPKGGTLTKALDKLANHAGAEWWVENDGMLYFGIRGTRGQILAAGEDISDIELSRYTVTQSSNTVSAVRGRTTLGPFNSQPLQGNSSYPVGILGVARTSEFNGSILQADLSNIVISTPSELEEYLTRTLIGEVMNDSSGSMEINVVGSRNKRAIRRLDVGDYIQVEENIQEHCKKNVYTGLFMVTSVHHRNTPQSGWTIDVEVTRTLDSNTIEVDSVFYNPQTDKRYETLDDMREERLNTLSEDWGLNV